MGSNISVFPPFVLFCPVLVFVSAQSRRWTEPQKLRPWNAAPAERPSTDSPSTATGRRKFIQKTIHVSAPHCGGMMSLHTGMYHSRIYAGTYRSGAEHGPQRLVQLPDVVLFRTGLFLGLSTGADFIAVPNRFQVKSLYF